jgi:hypothetical protein
MRIASFPIEGGQVTLNHLGGDHYSAKLEETGRAGPSAAGVGATAYEAVMNLTEQKFARPHAEAITRGLKQLPLSLAPAT